MKRFDVSVQFAVVVQEKNILAEDEEQAKQIAKMRAQKRQIGGDDKELDFAYVFHETDHELTGGEMSGEELQTWQEEVSKLPKRAPKKQTREEKKNAEELELGIRTCISNALLNRYFGEKSLESTILGVLRDFSVQEDECTFDWGVTQQTLAYEMCFEVDSPTCGIHGFVSVYYLKLREGSNVEIGSSDTLYVVEVGYDFD